MNILILDQLPAYISFEKQATKADGTKDDPTGTPTVSIYEEGGGDSSYDNSQITGSPFTCAKINSKTGNYGVLVDKTLFTAGKIYRALYEWTVDGVNTAAMDVFLAVNTSSFKADVSALALEATLTAIKGGGWTDETLKDIRDAITTLDGKAALEATLTAIKGAKWTTETLKAIKDAIDEIVNENFNGAGR